MKETIEEIKGIAGSLFDSLDEDQLRLLIKNLSVITYHPHEIITKQGAFVSHCILVRRGLLKIYIEGNGDKTILVNLSTTGELIGLPDLFRQGISGFSAASVTESEVFLIRTEILQVLVSINPAFGKSLLEEYSKFQSFLYQRLFSLGTKQMHGRLADVILYLTSEQFKCTELFSCISRKEIAELCGMSTESVVRLLKEFKDDGLVMYEGKEIRIKNLELLERLSRIG
jgi:CRP/FNR family transcriptional regulator, polysaccharide utilization system transcription regulator